MNPSHTKGKKEFQLERLILFSDAVFAIAITLLAIEIKVPELHGDVITDDVLLHSLARMIPKFIGFFISFFIIGQYWMVHHRLFGYVVDYNPRLLWLNLIFLLGVILMPFSTAFYSEYVVYFIKAPIVIYVINLIFLGSMNYYLWRYISNPANKLQAGLDTTTANYYSMRAVLVPGIFLLTMVVFLFAPRVAFFIPLTIPFVLRFASRWWKKKVLRPTAP